MENVLKCDHAHCRCMNLDGKCPNKHYADCAKEFETQLREFHNFYAEVAVFWNEMEKHLPKSPERAALGDEVIFAAFKAVYPLLKLHILTDAAKEKVLYETRTYDGQQWIRYDDHKHALAYYEKQMSILREYHEKDLKNSYNAGYIAGRHFQI